MFDLLLFISILVPVVIFIKVFYSNNFIGLLNLPLLFVGLIFYRLIINTIAYINTMLTENSFITTSQFIKIASDFLSMGDTFGNIIQLIILFGITYIVFILGVTKISNIHALFSLETLVEKSMVIDNDLKNKSINEQQSKVKINYLRLKVDFYSKIDGLSEIIKWEFIINLILLISLLFIKQNSYSDSTITFVVIGYFIPSILQQSSTAFLTISDKKNYDIVDKATINKLKPKAKQ